MADLKLSSDDWFEQFKPIENTENTGYGLCIDDVYYAFETFGQDLARVREEDESNPELVWTLIDDDEGDLVIVNGYHHIDSVLHFICSEPASKLDNYIVDYMD